MSNPIPWKQGDEKPKQKSKLWTIEETKALIAVYLRMISLQQQKKLGRASGQTSKAKLVREFIEDHAPERKKQSVEAKLMNISAAMRDLDLPIVSGYKPLPNGAKAIRKIIEGEL